MLLVGFGHEAQLHQIWKLVPQKAVGKADQQVINEVYLVAQLCFAMSPLRQVSERLPNVCIITIAIACS